MYVMARSGETYEGALDLPWFLFVGYLEAPAPGSFMEYRDRRHAAQGCAWRE